MPTERDLLDPLSMEILAGRFLEGRTIIADAREGKIVFESQRRVLSPVAVYPSFAIVRSDLQEPIRRKVGGSLAHLPPLQRLAMLRRNALLLRGQPWSAPARDGTLVRKTVGAPR